MVITRLLDEVMILPVTRLGLGTHLVVKVSRPGDSKVTFLVFKSSCHLLLYQSNHSKVEAIPLSALPKDTTKANLPEYNTVTLLAYNWLTFSIVWFFFQSVQITSHTPNPSEISLFYVFFFFFFFIFIAP